MDGQKVLYTKWNKSERKDKYFMISLICGLLKNKTNEHKLKQRVRVMNTENKRVAARGGWGRGDERSRGGRLRGTHF